MRFRLKTLPKVLILHLKRFSFMGHKLRNAVDFDEVVRIDPEFIAFSDHHHHHHHSDAGGQDHFYELYAVIIHKGYSTANGHYFSIVKNFEDGLWYKYDDLMVTCLGPDFSSVKKSSTGAYILFYKKNLPDFDQSLMSSQIPEKSFQTPLLTKKISQFPSQKLRRSPSLPPVSQKKK